MSFASLSALATRGRLTAGAVSGVLVLGAMAGTGVAVAKIPSSSTGQITACVAKPSGTTRIINAQKGKKCRAGEKTISWSRGWSYRGGWRSTTSYKVGDVVLSGGTSYLARKRSKAAKPGVATTVWVPLSTAGANGASGAVGATGAQGLKGDTGAAGSHRRGRGPQGCQRRRRHRRASARTTARPGRRACRRRTTARLLAAEGRRRATDGAGAAPQGRQGRHRRGRTKGAAGAVGPQGRRAPTGADGAAGPARSPRRDRPAAGRPAGRQGADRRRPVRHGPTGPTRATPARRVRRAAGRSDRADRADRPQGPTAAPTAPTRCPGHAAFDRRRVRNGCAPLTCDAKTGRDRWRRSGHRRLADGVLPETGRPELAAGPSVGARRASDQRDGHTPSAPTWIALRGRSPAADRARAHAISASA